MTNQNDVLEYVEEEGVKFIRLAFFDYYGRQKNVSILPVQLAKAFEKGVTIDGRCVYGEAMEEESNVILLPDPSTMITLPWRSMENGVILMHCDMVLPDGTPFAGDARAMLQRTLEKARAHGVDGLMASKFQFYLFDRDEKGHPTQIPFDRGTYMDVAPEDRGENIRREICLMLEEMGLDPHKSYHQQGPGQNEIDFHFSDPLSAADEASIFKWVVKTCAASNGLNADFSPKPMASYPGSAMHIQLRLDDVDAEKRAAFLAGLLHYLPQAQIFFCPSEESMQRLDHPASPQKAGSSMKQRNVMVRIPPLAADVLEIRLADANANPYLTFALVLECGMRGIEEGLSLETEESEGQPLVKSLRASRKNALLSDFVQEVVPAPILAAYTQKEAKRQ